MPETEKKQVRVCRRKHVDMLLGMLIGGGLVIVAVVVTHLAMGFPMTPHRYGYLLVPENNRAALIVEEFRQRTGFKPAIHLYASPFRQAYTSGGCRGGQYIVLSVDYINIWSEPELRAIIGHEVGHNLAACHANPTSGNSDLGQQEADGYGIELAGEDAFRSYWRLSGHNDIDIQKKMSEAKAALAALRKRAPLS